MDWRHFYQLGQRRDQKKEVDSQHNYLHLGRKLVQRRKKTLNLCDIVQKVIDKITFTGFIKVDITTKKTIENEMLLNVTRTWGNAMKFIIAKSKTLNKTIKLSNAGV